MLHGARDCLDSMDTTTLAQSRVFSINSIEKLSRLVSYFSYCRRSLDFLIAVYISWPYELLSIDSTIQKYRGLDMTR